MEKSRKQRREKLEKIEKKLNIIETDRTRWLNYYKDVINTSIDYSKYIK